MTAPTTSDSTQTELAGRGSVQRMVRAHLPARLRSAVEAVVAGEGDDLYFVLGYVAQSTARSYMSQLKYRGLAYTHVSGGTVEVWAHDKGRRLVRPNEKAHAWPEQPKTMKSKTIIRTATALAVAIRK